MSARVSTSTTTRTSRTRVALAVAAVGALAGGLVTGGAPAQAETTPAPMTQASLLRFDQITRAGLAVDDAVLGTRGDQLLGDAGRFDEGCLGEKTMRNITGAKAYPAPAPARAYVDATWTSTRDKDVWLSESIAQGETQARTDHYVGILLDEIADVRSCQEDPAQGNYYGPGRTVRSGTATATYFVDHEADGSTDGGGVAVIRDGDRFGYVDLMFGTDSSASTLRKLSLAAAQDLR